MIVCLGWGSLISNPGILEVEPEWRSDGPSIPIEFTRQSNDGRLTLVVEPSANSIPVLWTKMLISDLDTAIENLRQREGSTKKKYIGVWTSNDADPPHIPDLAQWSEEIGTSAVIWTALPSKFEDEDHRVPSLEEAVAYLEKLLPDKRTCAEQYIRTAPKQISTKYRKRFEEHFGWVCTSAT